MSWAWYSRDSDTLPHGAFLCFAIYAREATAFRAIRTELNRHVVLSDIPATDVDEVPVTTEHGERLALFGVPRRALNLGRLRYQLAVVRELPVTALVVADTGADSLAGFAWDVLTGAGSASVQAADAFASAGMGILDTLEGAGSAVEDVGSGLRDALPDLGAGAGDALRGGGSAARDIGAFTAAFPLVVVAGLGFVAWWLIDSGAVKIAPIKVGR